MNMQPIQPLLVVEDSDEDYKILLRIFRRLAFSHPIVRCANARECFDYLSAARTHGAGEKHALPEILLLDLNLPGTNGQAILRYLKADSTLKHIPVVIKTTSTNPVDVQSCYEEGASGYLIKPLDYSIFEETIRRFVDYWFHAVQLPYPPEEVF